MHKYTYCITELTTECIRNIPITSTKTFITFPILDVSLYFSAQSLAAFVDVKSTWEETFYILELLNDFHLALHY